MSPPHALVYDNLAEPFIAAIRDTPAHEVLRARVMVALFALKECPREDRILAEEGPWALWFEHAGFTRQDCLVLREQGIRRHFWGGDFAVETLHDILSFRNVREWRVNDYTLLWVLAGGPRDFAPELFWLWCV